VTLTADPADQREQTEPAGLRCAPAYLASGLPIIGSAPSEMTGWILLEHPGPWPKKGLPDDIDAELRDWLDVRPERVQLIHRVERRSARTTRRVYVSAGFDLLGLIELSSLDDLAGHIDAIEAAHVATTAGEPTIPAGFHLVADPPLLVCTQGRRDICCAQWGRPAAVALVDAFGTHRVWETNHLGGHRFAANLVIPPAALYHGQIEPDRIVELASELLAGRLPLPTLRGRSGLPPAAQAAEYFLRRDLGLTELDAISAVTPVDTSWRVELADGRAFLVDVGSGVGPDLPSSCGAEAEPQVRFDLVELRPE
jgi:hypothetical protein